DPEPQIHHVADRRLSSHLFCSDVSHLRLQHVQGLDLVIKWTTYHGRQHRLHPVPHSFEVRAVGLGRKVAAVDSPGRQGFVQEERSAGTEHPHDQVLVDVHVYGCRDGDRPQRPTASGEGGTATKQQVPTAEIGEKLLTIQLSILDVGRNALNDFVSQVFVPVQGGVADVNDMLASFENLHGGFDSSRAEHVVCVKIEDVFTPGVLNTYASRHRLSCVGLANVPDTVAVACNRVARCVVRSIVHDDGLDLSP